MFKSTRKRFEELEGKLYAYQIAYERADQRLDRSGKALVEALGDTVASHVAGRSNSVTIANEGYEVTIVNSPFAPEAIFRATDFDIPSWVWHLTSASNGDFDEFMLENMEKWVVGAKTGVPLDDERHIKRAAAVNQA